MTQISSLGNRCASYVTPFSHHNRSVLIFKKYILQNSFFT